MTEQELREKVKNIVHNELLYEEIKPFGNGTYAKEASKSADALISAGLTFDKTMAVLAERKNCKTLIQKAQYYDQMKHRAEVAERALRVLARKFVIFAFPNGDWKELIEQLVKEIKEQAEKELAEERKDD